MGKRIVLQDDPLSLRLAILQNKYQLNTDKDWQLMTNRIRKCALLGSKRYLINSHILRMFDWSIKRGTNLFVFVVGDSGKGKSLLTRKLITILQDRLQAAGFKADVHTTMTTSETQQIVRKSAKGTIIHQDEMPRLSGAESGTKLKGFYNWMEQSRAQRPFVFFCSPTIWLLPNIHFVLRSIPYKYNKDNPAYLDEVLAEVYVTDYTVAQESIKFRLIGYCLIEILPDGHPIKDSYFEAKEENLKKNAIWSGVRGVVLDNDERAEAVELIEEELKIRYSGENVLKVTRTKIRDTIKKLGIAIGSTEAEKTLASIILETIEIKQEKMREKLVKKQIDIVDQHIDDIFDDMPGVTKAAVQGLLRKPLTTTDEKTLKTVFDYAWEQISILKADLKEKTTRRVELTSSLPESFWSYLLDLMKVRVKNSGKLKKKIGIESWETKLELFYYRRILNWKPAEIISREEYKTIDNRETPRHYSKDVIDALNTNNAMKAFVGEEFFRHHFNALRTVSSAGVGGVAAAVVNSFSVSAGKACKQFFDGSISNQPVDCWLFQDGSENPVGIVEVKMHFAKDEYDPSPGNKYADKLGLPLFVFIIDCRIYGGKIRFRRLPEKEFFRENLGVNTVGTVSSMADVLQIIEKELAAAAEKNLLDQEVKA